MRTRKLPPLHVLATPLGYLHFRDRGLPCPFLRRPRARRLRSTCSLTRHSSKGERPHEHRTPCIQLAAGPARFGNNGPSGNANEFLSWGIHLCIFMLRGTSLRHGVHVDRRWFLPIRKHRRMVSSVCMFTVVRGRGVGKGIANVPH